MVGPQGGAMEPQAPHGGCRALPLIQMGAQIFGTEYSEIPYRLLAQRFCRHYAPTYFGHVVQRLKRESFPLRLLSEVMYRLS